MKKSRLARVAILLLVALSLSGCIWLVDDGPGGHGGGGGGGHSRGDGGGRGGGHGGGDRH